MTQIELAIQALRVSGSENDKRYANWLEAEYVRGKHTQANPPSFQESVVGQRAMILCELARTPILVDVISYDAQAEMLLLHTILAKGEVGKPWWMALRRIVTVAVVDRNKQPEDVVHLHVPPSGVIV